MLIRRAGRPWLCSLTTSSLGFPLSTEFVSRGHRGMDEAPQGRERVGQGSGCRKERESGGGEQTEVGVPQSRQDFRKGESQRSVARGQAWDPDLAPACPLSQRGRSSGPTTPKRKGQQEDSPLGLMLSLKGFWLNFCCRMRCSQASSFQVCTHVPPNLPD